MDGWMDGWMHACMYIKPVHMAINIFSWPDLEYYHKNILMIVYFFWGHVWIELTDRPTSKVCSKLVSNSMDIILSLKSLK